jgi:hypothetical protein
MIDFLLVRAMDHEGNRLSESEMRSTVQGCKLLSGQFEANGHHASFRARAALSVSRYTLDPRIFE